MNSATAESGQIHNHREASDVAESRLASLIPSSNLLHEEKADSSTPSPIVAPPQEDKYWSFPSEEEVSGPMLHLPTIVRLPPTSTTADQSREIEHEPIASLLPPRAIVAPQSPEDQNFVDIESLLPVKTQEPEIVVANKNGEHELSAEEQEIVDSVIQDSQATSTGVLTNARVNELAKSKIRRGYALANRGAYYAARQELIEVLRMISQSKDAQQGEAKRMLALAAGLRALEEAVDFAPRGTQLEADLEIEVICASHRTPVASQLKSAKILPRQMMDCYFRYAQLKLAAAVRGEPAGSMALHALGKLASRLNQVEPGKLRLAHRRAVVYQQAALLAHDQNHLAAHELAVLLADSGHYAEAEHLLKQVVAREPNATIYRNLARVQEKLGQTRQAATNQGFAQQLILQGTGGLNNVQWVSPQQFSGMNSNPTRFASAGPRPPVSPPAAPPQQYPSSTTNWR
ncbi:MAG: hypothetical protein GXP26_16110 [Planctomycetes bacterium]|nr:hypothetical protein [Planctomycetota bacterium]